MDNKNYNTIDAIEFISKMYPIIPKSIIRKVLHAEELCNYEDTINSVCKKYPLIPRSVVRKVVFAEDNYMYSIGLIDFEPTWLL